MRLDDILKNGERIYLEKYKEKLEREFLGFYVVIDVANGEYVVSENKLEAYESAKQKFGKEKLFFSTQIGSLENPSVNFKDKENATLSWAI